jgi:hypothetical protein
MSKTYNQVGTLSTIKTQLYNNDIKDLHSINDLISFHQNFSVNRQRIISNSSIEIKQEQEKLKEEVVLLEDFIDTCRSEYTMDLLAELELLKQQQESLRSSQQNFFGKVLNYLEGHSIKSKIRDIERNFDSKIVNSLRRYTDPFEQKKQRLSYIEHDFEKAVQENIYARLRELDRRKAIVDDLMPTIYGAIGELKVSKELESLPDSYILINDFSCSFYPVIYNRQENDHIQSVQVDHILVAPSGVFLIETKNWSEQSMNSLSLRSPVEQIRRTSFALYVTLNGDRNNFLSRHHWGERKIPIKNLIVMINQKPREEFQYVKVLTLKELVSYVEYFKPIFSREETQMIADYLLRICSKKN